MRKFFQRRRDKEKNIHRPDIDTAVSSSHLLEHSYEHMKERFTIAWIVSQLAEDLEADIQNGLFLQLQQIRSKKEINNPQIYQWYELAEEGLNWIKNDQIIENEVEKSALSKPFAGHFSRVLQQVQINEKARTKENRDSDWKIYRDVIYSATQGKLLLTTSEQINQYKNGLLLCEKVIKTKQDISVARNTAKQAFEQFGLDSAKIMSYHLIISEAVTNVIKHAGNGKMYIYYDQGEFRVVVEDNGPGFPLDILPKTTLLAGFSTKDSLGQGFTLMMKMSRQILLETSDQGSSLILLLAEKD
ncbi:Anti-sigma regulatory factor (Ser/Thr protein kinase) [Gracilibacillus ureilyticus]|uniref:Anti-sigma regulatory factor (Ser/Thr protein kinase) n=1 Tax=Gracilibacillus ureilyticus TaxID=531814 RepID=A0A1H9M556_9BACI|nr:ATP-binding protein [Gracilibacillus ureilyticus]SER18647.1 Anti-sigma regulatory factor (Ser/Thr protein kinase) [Gracilibacillus ureilyticus]